MQSLRKGTESLPVALIGAAGVGNRGDDFLAQVFAQRYSASFLVALREPDFSIDLEYISMDRATSTEVLKGTNLVVAGGSFVWSEEQLDFLLTVASKAVEDGGSLILRSVHVDSNIARLFPEKLKHLLRMAYEISVRDSQSIRTLEEIGIDSEYELDPIAAAARTFSKNRKVSRLANNQRQHPLRIGFNFHYLGHANVEWLFEFIATINHLVLQTNRETRLTYVTQCRHKTHWPSNELIVAEQLFSMFKGRMDISRDCTALEDLFSLYCTLDMFITNRTHGFLIADALVPTVIPLEIGGGRDKTVACAKDKGYNVVSFSEDPRQAAEREFLLRAS